MKDRPIIFSGHMVRAIIAGTKTQTRRVVRGVDFRGGGGKEGPDWSDPSCWGFADEYGDEWALSAGVGVQCVIPCPYGVPGDRLWVRETWRPADGMERPGERAVYAADWSDAAVRWRPSIHMPRCLSRITLELTEVRVQRLQEISEEDAKAEGAEKEFRTVIPIGGKPAGCEHAYSMPVSHRAGFANLWDSINAKRGHGWDSNPFCWVLTFRRVVP